jgi:hypothetical protein
MSFTEHIDLRSGITFLLSSAFGSSSKYLSQGQQRRVTRGLEILT